MTSETRKGWCLESGKFREELPGTMAGKLGENHAGELHQETLASRVKRILTEELRRLGWTESELPARRKSDPAKLATAARLRKETTLSMKGIAARVHLRRSRSANARLHDWMRNKGRPQTFLKP